MKKTVSTSKEQFNLLRIVDNESYPTFFEVDNNKYILKIELEEWKSITLHDFIDLSLEENNLILEWRNNPEVRKWMYNQHIIKLEEHLNFIENLKINKDKLYFLVKKEDKFIGVIYFIDIKPNESLKMGIYTNPMLKGNGKILLEIITNFSFKILKVKKIFSEVLFENEKAYNLYKNYNFKEIDKKIVDNKKVICMEKENDDYKESLCVK